MSAVETALDTSRFRFEREAMVTRQLRDRGITDERVLEAMLRLPRHLFVPDEERYSAYRDTALPIGFGQTISQPYMVATMLEALQLKGHERVLDIGTGSGYQAALLGLLTRKVYSVEIIPELTARARSTIEALGLDNVRVVQANGSIGLPQAAPFDAIVVAAGAPDVPPALTAQLAEGGTLVIPVGGDAWQELLRIRKRDGRLIREEVTTCAFVPLVGEQGWGQSQRSGSMWRV